MLLYFKCSLSEYNIFIRLVCDDFNLFSITIYIILLLSMLNLLIFLLVLPHIVIKMNYNKINNVMESEADWQNDYRLCSA